MPPDDENWLYHLPEFLDRVRERGAHKVVDEVDLDLGGVVYHHRGARIPAYDATFVWHDEENRFELELNAIGPRNAWVGFDADRSWDVYLARIGGDQPCLVWMTDTEFREEEANEFESKQEAIAFGRFSFGIYLHAPRTWGDVEERARSTDAPLFVSRSDGRTFVPDDADLEAFAAALPEELRPNDESPPDYLGVMGAHVDA
jgi:hypothetical protein